MIGDYPQDPSPPHLYSQTLQLKLYQTFIFSIPVLFSIILLLLFYLFYLKRRINSNLSSPPSTVPRTFSHGTPLTTLNQLGLKGNQIDKLPMILFNEELSTRDSQCCVCLGEFEMKEELNQIPSCKHMFHVDCIRHWLHSNSTCPLCRCSVVANASKNRHSNPSNAVVRQEIENFNQNPQIAYLEQQEQVVLAVLTSTTDIASCSREQSMALMEGSSSTAICMDINDDSVVLGTNGLRSLVFVICIFIHWSICARYIFFSSSNQQVEQFQNASEGYFNITSSCLALFGNYSNEMHVAI